MYCKFVSFKDISAIILNATKINLIFLSRTVKLRIPAASGRTSSVASTSYRSFCFASPLTVIGQTSCGKQSR